MAEGLLNFCFTRKIVNMIRVFRTTLAFFFIGLAMSYIILCGAEGIKMTYNLSNWYVLIIVRVFVIVLCTIFNLLAMPFIDLHKVWLTIVNSALIFPLFGLLYSLITSSGKDVEKSFGPAVLVFILLGIVIGVYWYTVYQEDFTGSIYAFLFG